jgi:hypothetical protein
MTIQSNTIVNGDCLRILPQLDAGSVDFVRPQPVSRSPEKKGSRALEFNAGHPEFSTRRSGSQYR